MTIDHGEYQELVDSLRRKLLKTARKTMHGDKIKTIELAFQVANQAHLGQFRKSGEPYITHPIEVATFIAEWDLDEQTIAGALMHDVIEDTPVTKKELARIFGNNIAELVDSVTKLDKLHFESEAAAHAEYFRKVVLAMAKDVRVILIKLADRMHNMLTLGSMRKKKKKRIARETMEIYVPIANRIGLHKVHLELAEESFKYLYPMRYKILKHAAEKALIDRQPTIQAILTNIEAAMRANGIHAEFKYRQRTISNIYNRMLKRNDTFNNIYNIFEVKVIVDKIGDCYLALGVLHSIYQPIPSRFKDYIAIPKTNGYQSLHSTTMGPNGTPIQLHIRTKEMEEIAEQGVISHWIKENHSSNYNKASKQTSNWLSNILDIQSSTATATDFLDNILKDLSPNNIYVFTPKGRILHLPKGSTPVDFAYAIHTNVGCFCSKARINQRLSSLDTKLQNGDIIEIITNNSSEPDKEWLNFAVTGKAISKIKQYFKEQKSDEEISCGISLFNYGLAMTGHSDLVNNRLDEFISKNYPRSNHDEFLQRIGSGDLSVLNVVEQYTGKQIEIHLSKCIIPIIQDIKCYPVPGEEILARINRRGELELHYNKCTKLKSLGVDNFTAVTIINDIEKEFLSKIILFIDNQSGVFNKLSAILAERKINMEEIHQERSEDTDHNELHLTITTHSVLEINNLLESLRNAPFVIQAIRI